MAVRHDHWINGRATPSASGSYLPTLNPRTRQHDDEIAAGSPADVEAAVAAAAEAQREWARRSGAERSTVLHRVADALEERAQELIDLEMASTGKIESQAGLEIDMSAAYFRYYAGIVRAHHGRTIDQGDGNHTYTRYEPYGATAAGTVRAVCAVSSPIDLAAGGRAIGTGFNRQVYTRMFLRTMKPKALALLAQHPGLFDRARLLAARTLHEFDNVFTAPLHGFRDADDYWSRGSAKPHLHRIRIPALVLNALNDPFVPAHCLPHSREVGPSVTLWQPLHGGHVGFPAGRWPGHVHTLPERVMAWIAQKV